MVSGDSLTHKTMTQEQDNKAWGALTPTQRTLCRNMYQASGDGNVEYLLDELFGEDNLSSDTEPAEMLMVEKERARDMYDFAIKYGMDSEAQTLTDLFGNKCLPDESTEKPTPKFRVGDKVVILDNILKNRIGSICEIIADPHDTPQYREGEIQWKLREASGNTFDCPESQFELYIGTKQTSKSKFNFNTGDRVVTKTQSGKLYIGTALDKEPNGVFWIKYDGAQPKEGDVVVSIETISAPKPSLKYKAGDKVIIVRECSVKGEATEVVSVDPDDYRATYQCDILDDEGGHMWFKESDLIPCPEPQNTENMEEKPSLCDACANESLGSCKVNIGCDGALMPTCDRDSCDDYKLKNMEEKETNCTKESDGCDKEDCNELNLGKLLAKAIGEDFFSPTYGKITLKEMHDIWMVFEIDGGGTITPPSRFMLDTGFIPIYPSKDLFSKYPLDAPKAWQIWAEERKPNPTWWRAEKGEKYWMIGSIGNVLSSDEYFSMTDDDLYNFGNYFHDKETAKRAADLIRETLINFHNREKE